MKFSRVLRSYAHYGFAVVWFGVITGLITFPLILHLNNSIIGGYGDGLYFAWLIRWYQGVIFEGSGVPFFNAQMNFPEGWNLSTTDTALATSLPGVPFSWSVGPLAGYNIAMVLTFILSGLAMYVWVYHLTRSKSSALLAGSIYAFLPYRIAHFQAGHLNLSGTAWFPIYFMGLFEVLHSRTRWHWAGSLTTAAALGLIAFSSMYYLYFTLLMSVVFVLAYLAILGWRQGTQGSFWARIAGTAMLAMPLVLLALRPFLYLSRQGGLAERSLDYANQYSASPTDFFFFPSSHFLFGRWSSQILDHSLWMESSLYIGLVSLGLLLFAVLKRAHSPQRGLILITLVMISSAFLIALGPQLHWNNRVVTLGQSPITLPATYLFRYLPFFDHMRAVLRIGVFALVFTSLSAGLGMHLLLSQTRPSRRRWLTLGLIALALFEFWPGSMTPSLIKIEARPVDYWLAQQANRGAVVQMPFEESTNQAQLYYSLTHGKPITGGFFNANQPPQYLYLQPILSQFPDSRSVETLREYQVAFIVIDPGDYPDFDAVESDMLQLGLQKLTEKEGLMVYGFR